MHHLWLLCQLAGSNLRLIAVAGSALQVGVPDYSLSFSCLVISFWWFLTVRSQTVTSFSARLFICFAVHFVFETLLEPLMSSFVYQYVFL